MMRSLWSGVSGLNAHQVAMDVEANNIANVNTTGFKYSRTNFQNLLSQTVKSATAPQGDLGGKNSLQIGLGTTVSSVETMFKQGSIQSTDKNTDMAINGDGFFIVSDDAGKTYKYTRSGDFTFDSQGNFVDPNGFIVQGWMADDETHSIDTAKGVKPISIKPGLTTPANPTKNIQIKANLNSGDKIEEKSPTRATVNITDDFNGLYNANGEPIELREDEDYIKLSIDKDGDGVADTTIKFIYGKSSSNDDHKFQTIKDLTDEINNLIKDTTGKKSASSYKLFLDGNGKINDPENRIIIDNNFSSTNSTLQKIFESLRGPTKTTETIKAIRNSFIGADDVGELFNDSGKALNLKDGQGLNISINGLGENRKFIYTSKPINETEGCGGVNGSYQASEPIISDSNEGLHWTYDSNNDRAFFNVNQKIKLSLSNGDDIEYTYGKDFQTINDLVCIINSALNDRDINDTLSFGNGQIQESNGDGITNVQLLDSNGNPPAANSPLDKLNTIFSGLNGNGDSTNKFKKNDIYYFHDTQDLVNIYQMAIDDSGDELNSTSKNKGIVSINEDGKISIENTSESSFNITIKGYPNDEKDNQLFTDAFSPLNGTVAAGAAVLSQPLNAATHTTSIDVFDSLGSKHTITIHFRKTHTSTSATDPTEWKWWADSPDPTKLDNPANGYVKFNSDGSLNSFNPPSLIFNANNGSKSGQSITLDFGDLNKFNGITSFEAPSATSGQSQDGYPGGDLQQLVVDQTGTIIGVFTNGRSYSLAQIALAKFTNNEGLMSEGGTLFNASPNSGEPIIGAPGTAGRGTIQPSALEMSNVDLSRSLTELIVIQRGFQANSKTITTSDQMLNTLLQLKR